MLAELSRRDLLERALAAAAASVACLPLARARADKPASVGPNDRLRVAVVGANGRGTRQYRVTQGWWGAQFNGGSARQETRVVAPPPQGNR